MISIVQNQLGRIFIACVMQNEDSEPVDPAYIMINIYCVKPGGGLEKIQENVELNKQDNELGFFGISVNISEFIVGNYVVLFKARYEGKDFKSVESFKVEYPQC